MPVSIRIHYCDSVYAGYINGNFLYFVSKKNEKCEKDLYRILYLFDFWQSVS